MRYSSKRHLTTLLAALRPIYQAPTLEAAQIALDEMEAGEIGQRYPAIPRAGRASWEEFTPFLAYRACCKIGASRESISTFDEDGRRGSLIPTRASGSGVSVAAGYARVAA